MAMALSKDWISEAYNNISKSFETNDLSIDIKIDTWNGTTTNGQNEKELLNDLDNHIDKELDNELWKYGIPSKTKHNETHCRTDK